NIVMNAALTALMHGRCAEDVTLTALPLAHVYGNVVMNGTLMTGGTLILVSPFDAAQILAGIADHRATRFEGVPTMYYDLLGSDALRGANLTSLTLCTVGGQTMPIERMRAVEERFGCPLIELWGMSEIAGLGTTFPHTGPRTLGSIGIPLPGIQARTVDLESRAPVGADIPGELQIRGPIVMRGSLGNPAATDAVLDVDGWLSTGDIARIDNDGQIFIVDRSKDVILTSGNNVYPAEIERVIAAHPAVLMVAVGRDPHPRKGEAPHAYVVLRKGCVAEPGAIIDLCRHTLAPYKIPASVSFVADLPRNSTGKILRRALDRTAS
ncbi:MAG: AMP-binding protein, partial [Sphingopyxis sp.]|nr:AMP-binding protein [Sphingopyxis sp.]